MKVMTILGTRPEIIRLSRVIPLLDAHADHVLVHTGQNYTDTLSGLFFRELEVRDPDMFLGVKAVIARSFERIHSANLINFGIIPLIFHEPDVYNRIAQGDEIEIAAIRKTIQNGGKIIIRNITRGEEFECLCELSERQKALLLAGGALNLKK